MFNVFLNWLKKNELLTIECLKDELLTVECLKDEIDQLSDAFDSASQEIMILEQRLSDAIKIANGKYNVTCRNNRCMDWENGKCVLKDLVITPSGRCEDADDGGEMRAELAAESKNGSLESLMSAFNATVRTPGLHCDQL